MTVKEPPHEWRSSDGLFVVKVSLRVLQDLHEQCRSHNETETGGILVGQYSDDRKCAEVLKAYPPPSDSARGRWWFIRGTLGLAATLARLWNSKSKQYYVGEWHYHPSSNVRPSKIDTDQMRSIAQLDNYHCKDPILIIIGAEGTSGVRPISITIYPDGSDSISLISSRYSQ